MCIKITVAHTVSNDAYMRIVAFTSALQDTDINFEGLPIQVERGDLARVDVKVTDNEDELREKLLQLLVEHSATPTA